MVLLRGFGIFSCIRAWLDNPSPKNRRLLQHEKIPKPPDWDLMGRNTPLIAAYCAARPNALTHSRDQHRVNHFALDCWLQPPSYGSKGRVNENIRLKISRGNDVEVLSTLKLARPAPIDRSALIYIHLRNIFHGNHFYVSRISQLSFFCC